MEEPGLLLVAIGLTRLNANAKGPTYRDAASPTVLNKGRSGWTFNLARFILTVLITLPITARVVGARSWTTRAP